MNRSSLFAAVVLTTTSLPAQDQATTLLDAARAADVVVVAKVAAATDPSPAWHRLQFATLTAVKGNPPADFAVLEPAGACCGRSLFALTVGDQRLLFLRRRGATWHPFGGARGVVPATPEVIAHVRSLLAAANDQALSQLLANALLHAEPRVADDAAHALAVLPALSLSPSARAIVAECLQAATARGTTRTAALAEIVARQPTADLLDAVLPIYLDSERSDHARLLRRALARSDGDAIAARLPLFTTEDRRAVRAAELLVQLPTAQAQAALDGLLQQHGHPRVALCVAESLLASGVRAEQLAVRIPAPVLELAQQRLQTPRRFRAIDPNRP